MRCWLKRAEIIPKVGVNAEARDASSEPLGLHHGLSIATELIRKKAKPSITAQMNQPVVQVLAIEHF